MKNKILFLIILLLIPTLVLAKDTCDDNDIKIKSITLKELNGFSEEIQESSINNNTIKLNLKMYDVGDSSTYDITVENTSSEDYYFTKDSMKLENDYLEYSLKNDSEVIPANSTKTIKLKVSYKNKIPNDSYSNTSKLIISLSDKPLENPKTKMTYTFLFVIISLIIIINIYTKVNNKSFNKKNRLLMISLLSIIPISINALCTINLNVETKIEIENKEAVFLPGKEVNVKMKKLAGDDTSTISEEFSFQDETITAIKYSEIQPMESNKEEKNIVSASDSTHPIYMWYEDGTIYWWSEDSHPSLNEDASYMFYHINELNNIDILSKWSTDKTNNMSGLFAFTSITDLKVLKSWNTSSVKSIGVMFSRNNYLKTLDGLENWDVSNVTNMIGTFAYIPSLISIKSIKNWDTSNVESMQMLFHRDNALTRLDGLENWDTSNVNAINNFVSGCTSLTNIDGIKRWNLKKVTTMSNFFASCYSLEEIDIRNWKTSNSLKNISGMFAMSNLETGKATDEGTLKRIILPIDFNTKNVTTLNAFLANNDEIEDYSFLKKIDTSSVTDMYLLFQNNYNFHDDDFQYIKDWNVSNVENMQHMFFGNNITSLELLKDWTVSHVTNFSYMFDYCKELKTLTGLENWDTSSATTMKAMFLDAGYLMDITSISNWDVSNVKNYDYMFAGDRQINNVNAINNWNISKDATFTHMFRNVPNHPEFTKLQGTWSNGTFTPTP